MLVVGNIDYPLIPARGTSSLRRYYLFDNNSDCRQREDKNTETAFEFYLNYPRKELGSL